MTDDYFIIPKDIERIHGVSNRTARRMLWKVRKHLGKNTGEKNRSDLADPVTYREFRSLYKL